MVVETSATLTTQSAGPSPERQHSKRFGLRQTWVAGLRILTFSLLLLLFGPCLVACRILVIGPRSKPGPQQGVHGVLATGAPVCVLSHVQL